MIKRQIELGASSRLSKPHIFFPYKFVIPNSTPRLSEKKFSHTPSRCIDEKTIMFSLLYGFWEYMFHKGNYFVLILGLDNSGKTTFLEHARCNFNRNYRHVDLNRIASTVGLNVGKIETKGVVLNFWDLGGQKELQLLWDKYFLEAHGIIWVVDSSDRDRLNESVETFTKIIKNELLFSLPLLFIINKQDLSTAMRPDEVIDAYKKSLELIGNRRFLSIPTSALRGNGINESIGWIGEQVKISHRPPSD